MLQDCCCSCAHPAGARTICSQTKESSASFHDDPGPGPDLDLDLAARDLPCLAGHSRPERCPHLLDRRTGRSAGDRLLLLFRLEAVEYRTRPEVPDVLAVPLVLKPPDQPRTQVSLREEPP